MISILVPTGGSDTDSALFETALAVARLFSSHLQFLHIHIGAGEAALNVPHAEFAMAPALSNALEELDQSATIRSATAFRHFRDFCARSSIAICDAPTYPTGVTASWHEQPGKALKRIMFFARLSDLVVVGRARKANGMTTDFIEQLLVKSGRPVLIAPSAPRQTLANTIMVCWRETAEAVGAFNFHHKTGAVVLHPLQDSDGTLFYGDAEEVLAKVPRRGIPLILHETRDKTEGGRPKPTKLYSASGMAKLVRRLRDEAGPPTTFTLDACRHGGMTELEEAELTDGQGRALSAHRSRAYEGYAKRTMERALAATRKRHAHRIAAPTNAQGNRISE